MSQDLDLRGTACESEERRYQVLGLAPSELHSTAIPFLVLISSFTTSIVRLEGFISSDHELIALSISKTAKDDVADLLNDIEDACADYFSGGKERLDRLDNLSVGLVRRVVSGKLVWESGKSYQQQREDSVLELATSLGQDDTWRGPFTRLFDYQIQFKTQQS